MGGGDGKARRWLDDEVLAQLRRVGGEVLVTDLMRLYLTHTPERVRRARRALARSDLSQVAKAAHSLRSASATLGATELAVALGALEAAAERGDGEAVSRDWPAIEDRVAALLEHIGGRAAEG